MASGSTLMAVMAAALLGQAGGPDVTTLEPGHRSRVTSLAFSPDGRLLASASSYEARRANGVLKLWDVQTGELRNTLDFMSQVESVAFSPDGRKLAVGGGVLYHSFAGLFDVGSGNREWSSERLGGHASLGVAFSPDGRTVATGASGFEEREPVVKLLDAATGKLQRELTGHRRSVILSVAFSPDGKTLAAGCSDDAGGTMVLWDGQTGVLQRKVQLSDADRGNTVWVGAVAFTPDGRTIATAVRTGSVRLWDARTGMLVRELSAEGHSPMSLAFSPDGRLLASASWEESIAMWDVATGKEQQVTSQENGGTVVAFSPDGKSLAVGTKDGSVRLLPVGRK